jgi:hypothetical protein
MLEALYVYTCLDMLRYSGGIGGGAALGEATAPPQQKKPINQYIVYNLLMKLDQISVGN